MNNDWRPIEFEDVPSRSEFEELTLDLLRKGVTDADRMRQDAYSDDVNGRFQRDVNGHSGHVNKVGAQRRWDYNHARHLRD